MPSTSDICIVGLGLMGGSLALALKQAGWGGQITAVSRNRATLTAAELAGAIDRGTVDLAQGVHEAGIVVLATPVRTLLRQLEPVGQHARAGAVVLDMGSTKVQVCAELNRLPLDLQPVGGHPMCGKERAGFDAADANLYREKTFVLCPLPRTTETALETVRSLAEAAGARPLVLDATAHDRAAAAISHLPYAAAVALVNAVSRGNDPLSWTLASSGFRDTSRVAASDVEMMLDILFTNRLPILEWMRLYMHELSDLYDALAEQDEMALRKTLSAAQTTRTRLSLT